MKLLGKLEIIFNIRFYFGYFFCLKKKIKNVVV